jgi:hypothetical protein
MKTFQKVVMALLLTSVLAPAAHAYAEEIDERIPAFGWDEPEEPDETMPAF